MSEKASQGWFLKQEKLQNHINKGKEKKKERAEGKEEKRKKAMVALLVFILATLESFWPKKLLDAKDPLAITFSKIRLDVRSHLSGTQTVTTHHHFVAVPRHWFPRIKCGQPLSL